MLLGRGYTPKVMRSPNVTDFEAANANNDEVYEDLWRRLRRDDRPDALPRRRVDRRVRHRRGDRSRDG